jgi:hypothetical protein
MKKTLLISVLGFLLTFGVAVAAVPEGNRMQLGEISDSLPGVEMKAFFAKMNPLRQQIFGPSFSNINLKIQANLNGTIDDTGYSDTEQTLTYAGQAKDYQNDRLKNPQYAMEQIYKSMLHELGHGMYYYDNNKIVTFHPKWVNEGWAKLQETMLTKELGINNFDYKHYFRYYLDRETVAGTTIWGYTKQTTNCNVDYDITTITHLTLLSAASTSNNNLDFLKTFNNKLYDWVKSNNQTDISLAQYKIIMRGLLQEKTVDGQPAFDWYFNNPDSLTEGKSGNHLGITTEPGEIIAYAFDRETTEKDILETALPNLDITIKAVNYDGKILLNKTVKTDKEGNARVNLPKNGDSALMTIDAAASISGKPYTTSTFYFDGPPREDTLSGVLIDETGKPLPAKYIGLLKSDTTFDYKDKGVFYMTVPNTARTVVLDFLGFKQEVTKGPFARMFAMTVPTKYIEEASRQTEEMISNGIIKNHLAPADRFNPFRNQKNSVFTVGIGSLVAIIIGAIAIMYYPFGHRKK